jgi:hypothetical protein
LGEADDFALKHAEAGRATVEFFTLLEQRLLPDAYPKERPAGLNKLA